MQTVTDNLREMASEIQNLLQNLLLNHSSIYRWNPPDSRLIVAGRDYEYKKLDKEGRQIQAHLLEKYRRFYALLTVLLKEQPNDTIKELSEADPVMGCTIEQNQTMCKNTQEALDEAVQALQAELEHLNRLYNSSDDDAP